MIITLGIINIIEGEYLLPALLMTGLAIVFIGFIEKRIFKKYYLPGEVHYKSCLGIIIFFFLAYGGIAVIDNHIKNKNKAEAIKKEAETKELARLKEKTILVISISTEDSTRVPKEKFTGRDSLYRNNKYVYINDTGRRLIEYRVKYISTHINKKLSSSASDSIPVLTEGRTIEPNEYFEWYNASNYHKFTMPKDIIFTIDKGKYSYIYFIDYLDNFDNVKSFLGY